MSRFTPPAPQEVVNDRVAALWIGAAVALLYILTFASVPTSDGLSFIEEIDEATHTGRLPVISNAPFSYYLGFLLKRGALSLGLEFPTLWILQGVNAAASGLGAAFFYRSIRLAGGTGFWALVGTLLVMTSYGVWYFANGEVHHVALAILLFLFYRLMRIRQSAGDRSPMLTLIGLGALNAVAVFFHQEHFLFGLVAVALLLVGRPWRRGRREVVAYGLAGTLGTMLLIVGTGWLLAGVRTLRGIVGWYFWQLGYLARDYQPEPIWVIGLRLVKGQLTAFVYGFQAVTDAVRDPGLLQIGLVKVWVGLTLVALFLAVVLAGGLWKERKKVVGELRALQVSALVWLVSYPVLLSWYFPAVTEYYLKTVPPLVLLLLIGPMARESTGGSSRALRAIGLALLAIVIAVNAGSAIVPWYRYGVMRERVALWARQTLQPGDLVVSMESGIDPLLAGRSDRIQVKNLLYEKGKTRGFSTIRDQIEAHLADGHRVFVYNLVASRWGLFGLNDPARRPYGDHYRRQDFEAFVADLEGHYDLVPVLAYWEESQEPLYLFGRRQEQLLQVQRRSELRERVRAGGTRPRVSEADP